MSASVSPNRRAELRVGGVTPFTTIDFPGRLAAVVYVQGCPWRCGYCHNPHLQSRAAGPARTWAEVAAWLRRRRGLLDGVVFSGGEPTLDAALGDAVDEARALGYATGLHTAGIYPARLAALLPRLDWVGLDIKAPLADAALHDRITGVEGGAAAVQRSLGHMLASGVAYECRTTADDAWLDDAALRRLSADLARRGVAQWALQACRRPGAAASSASIPSARTWAELSAPFARCTLRGPDGEHAVFDAPHYTNGDAPARIFTDS
ncbi:MAG: anaerobic ribonucleoside-triphosphate reductase activating protein [Burkholderiales bacterium]|nr:anaerobic ribonucleoside-triphosphate reductase activating protein [Burkholderiales bacterium]MDE1927260.1 anaerobic ribonucleoside-triphosphate reductase activating protein [Burkholderiales bacterium]MDE2157692.1 anaerobic ribonucleoside-triphosphate reductase activating protein [Burkholderiales bacterium]MDE2503545.1 anaerobic ribonucleoside-triphosphate reductase activating protein [Burkholderiales bacterium]